MLLELHQASDRFEGLSNEYSRPSGRSTEPVEGGDTIEHCYLRKTTGMIVIAKQSIIIFKIGA